MKITLKKAREKGKLDEFIKEHEKDKPGDADRLDKAINKAVRNDPNHPTDTVKTKKS